MIVQKIKDNKVKFIAKNDDNNKIESFSLLIVNTDEFLKLINCFCPSMWSINEEAVIEFKYTKGDEFDKLYNKIALTHQKCNKNFIDVKQKINEEFIPKYIIEGTSMLLRDVQSNKIKIAFRKNNKEYSINKIPISNEVRELFFKDAKNCKAYLFSYYDQKRKYEVCFEDDCYIKWSTFMNNEYLKLSNK